MRRTILALSLLLTTVLPATAQPRWNLEACLDSALVHAPLLGAARQQRIAAHAQARSERGQRLPRLGLEASAGYVSETSELTLPAGPGGAPIRMELGSNRSYDLALAVSAPLYAGGALRAREEAAHGLARAADAELAGDSLGLLRQLRLGYYRALAAEASASLAGHAVDRLERQHEDLLQAQRAGSAGREERIAVELQLAELQQARAAAEAARRATWLELGRLVGRPGEQIAPAGGLESSLIAATAGQQSELERPDLRALRERINSAEQKLRAARASHLPSLSLQGGYHYGRPGVDLVQDEWMGYAQAALRLSWTLYDFDATGQRIEQAQASARALREQHRAVRQGWRTRLAQVEVKLDAAEESVQLSRRRLELQRERRALVKQRHEQGLASRSELLDSEDELASAEQAAVRATAELRQAEVELLHVLGR